MELYRGLVSQTALVVYWDQYCFRSVNSSGKREQSGVGAELKQVVSLRKPETHYRLDFNFCILKWSCNNKAPEDDINLYDHFML